MDLGFQHKERDDKAAIRSLASLTHDEHTRGQLKCVSQLVELLWHWSDSKCVSNAAVATIAAHFRKSEKTIGNWLRWGRTAGVVNVVRRGDGQGAKKIVFMDVVRNLAHRRAAPQNRPATVATRPATVSVRPATVSGLSHYVSSYDLPPSHNGDCVAWKLVEAEFSASGLTAVPEAINTAQELGYTPQEVLDAVKTYKANQDKLTSPGALVWWMKHDRQWPSDDSVRDWREIEAAKERRDNERRVQAAGGIAYQIIKDGRKAGKSDEEITVDLDAAGVTWDGEVKCTTTAS